MTEVATVETLTAEQAESLEVTFLGGLEEAQVAYERIVEHEAWIALGFDSFTAWWAERVQPMMHTLSMRPTREIAAAVVDRVREEEVDLPPAQRRTQRELADMVGVHPDTVSGRKRQDRDKAEAPPGADLEKPGVDAACEACGGPMDAGQHESGFMRCDACDGEESHVSAGFPNGRDGGCATCAAEAKPDETPLPGGQDKADAAFEAIDQMTAGQAAKPRPPKWDPEERRLHEEEVARIRDIEAARRTAKTFVTTIQAEILTIVAGYRLGERGLVTREQIAQIRKVVGLLEKELDDEQ